MTGRMRALTIAGALILVVGVAIVVGRRRFERATNQRVEALLSIAERPDSEPISREDYAECPAPVRRYFDAVIEDGRSHV